MKQESWPLWKKIGMWPFKPGDDQLTFWTKVWCMICIASFFSGFFIAASYYSQKVNNTVDDILKDVSNQYREANMDLKLNLFQKEMEKRGYDLGNDFVNVHSSFPDSNT